MIAIASTIEDIVNFTFYSVYLELYNMPTPFKWKRRIISRCVLLGSITFSLALIALFLCIHFYNNDTSSFKKIPRRYVFRTVITNNSYLAERRSTLGEVFVEVMWGVKAAGGVIVRDSKFTMVGFLPKGSLFCALETNETMYIKVIFPLLGWVEASNLRLSRLSLLDTAIATSLGDDISVCNPSTFLVNTDFQSGDLFDEPRQVKSAEECCQLCMGLRAVDNRPCRGFTFTPDGSCWLKDTTFAEHKIEGLPFVSARVASVSLKNVRSMRATKVGAPCCDSKDVGAGNDPLPQSVDAFSAAEKDSSDVYTMRVRRLRGEWTEQWPIGTGRVGALVGGTLHEEVIPISISDFFVSQDTGTAATSKADPKIVFRSVRDLLQKGRTLEAQQMLSEIQEPPMGSFEYLADICLLFSPNSFTTMNRNDPTPQKPLQLPSESVDVVSGPFLRPRHSTRVGARVLSIFSQPHLPLLPPIKKIPPVVQDMPGWRAPPQPEAGRKGLLKALRAEFDLQNPTNRFRQPIVADGILDMEAGLTTDVFVDSYDSNSHNKDNFRGRARYARIHHREWFASAVDLVVVGHMSCRRTTLQVSGGSPGARETEDIDNSGSCLNAVFHLSRDPGGSKGLIVRHTLLEHIHERSAPSAAGRALPLRRRLDKILGSHTVEALLNYDGASASSASSARATFAFETTMEPGKGLMLPYTSLCGIVHCYFNRSIRVVTGFDGDAAAPGNNYVGLVNLRSFRGPGDAGGGEGQAVVCNVASSLDVFVAAESSRQDGAGEIATCWQRVAAAVLRRRQDVKARHTREFSKQMSRVELSLSSDDDAGGPHACTDAAIPSRLASFSSGCTDESGYHQSGPKSIDTHLVSQAFQYGRYLLLSAGSNATLNLQGLWADGATSAWSGDYHLNINMQQAYWAVDTAAVHEAASPLMHFIRRLSRAGVGAARELYGAKDPEAWVAHGFTDDRLNCGMLGDPKWAMCVTCGAWMALHAWDHLAFQMDSRLLMQTVIPVLRGAIKFFSDYMWVDFKGRTHTGPTTSPENSYEVKPAIPFNGIHRRLDVKISAGGWTWNGTATKKPLKPVPQRRKYSAEQRMKSSNRAPNLYVQQQQQQQQQRRQRTIRFLAFSPAIDISILRQLANAFTMSLHWAEKRQPRSVPQEDFDIADKFRTLVSKMPGNGLPVVSDQSGRVLEYPDPLPGNGMGDVTSTPEACVATTAAESLNMTSTVSGCDVSNIREVSEDLDPGHRHFSPLHWLFPGIFHPGEGDDDATTKLFDGSKRLLRAKMDAHGGHTSWSAAWEANLWARLRDGDAAFSALSRILSRYSAPNLLSLHPDLDPRPDIEECSTCFSEGSASLVRPSSAAHFTATPTGRGLVTAENDKFQIDGNLGFVSAVCEMLLQSQVPSLLSLLPALPKAGTMSAGMVRGLRARGDVTVSMAWKKRGVELCTIDLRAFHPWLLGMAESEEGSGFFVSTASNRTDRVKLVISSPNSLRLLENEVNGGSNMCVSTAQAKLGIHARGMARHWTMGARVLHVVIHRWPCVLALCRVDMDDKECRDRIATLRPRITRQE